MIENATETKIETDTGTRTMPLARTKSETVTEKEYELGAQTARLNRFGYGLAGRESVSG